MRAPRILGMTDSTILLLGDATNMLQTATRQRHGADTPTEARESGTWRKHSLRPRSRATAESTHSVAHTPFSRYCRISEETRILLERCVWKRTCLPKEVWGVGTSCRFLRGASSDSFPQSLPNYAEDGSCVAELLS